MLERLIAASNPAAEIEPWPKGIAAQVMAAAPTGIIHPHGDMWFLLKAGRAADTLRRAGKAGRACEVGTRAAGGSLSAIMRCTGPVPVQRYKTALIYCLS